MAEGHRGRLRERAEHEDFDRIPEKNVLEMMLHGMIMRRDTEKMAQQLIDKFGSLASVIDAPVELLTKVPGIGEATAKQLKMLPMFYRRYVLSKQEKDQYFTNSEVLGNYFIEKYVGIAHEVPYLMCLDSKYRMLACEKLEQGTFDSAGINVRTVLKIALKFNSRRVCLAHNHPSGNPGPSEADKESTRQLVRILNQSGIILLDHIIVSDDYYVSMAEHKLFSNML